jgi:hypothetical protein
MIKLEIKRIIDNPKYDENYAKNRPNMYSERYDEMIKAEKTIVSDILNVEITDEQFEAIRKAVLEVF